MLLWRQNEGLSIAKLVNRNLILLIYSFLGLHLSQLKVFLHEE